MTNTISTNKVKAWAKAMVSPAQEFPLTPLSVISGEIPAGLRGSLYRNGPGRLTRGGQKVGHWFDGDGAILAVHFTDKGATGVYRYVQTKGYLEELQANKYLYGNYGMTAPGPFWNQWLKPVKNAANTSVIACPDKLLALWEVGQPYRLDLNNLNTYGEDDLGGIDKNLIYSAHPKRDGITGEIFNFGVTLGLKPQLKLYKGDRHGKILKTSTFTLEGMTALHDFILAGQYLIFIIPALRLNVLPALLGINTISDAWMWQPQLGNKILIFDRDNLTLVSQGETEPWFQWHFGNGYVDKDGLIVLDIARYDDFTTNQRLKEVATGVLETKAISTLWQVRLDPHTAKVKQMQQVLNRSCEFPIVSPQEVGQNWRYTYLVLHRENIDITTEIFDTIGRFDYQTGKLMEANLGDNCYPVEPIYAGDVFDVNKGWILTVVYNGNTDNSEVWVFDSDRLDGETVCKLALPSVIPIGFHGTWKPA